MDFEFWYLVLIPLFFGAGWWARGFETRDKKNNEEALPEAYTRAVKLLTVDDPERGLEALVDVARQDPDLVDLQQVLGTLFRRRGEFEKAIRLHRHLCERPDVDEETRRTALKSLGDDYLRAGLFDRAENVYRALSKDPTEYLSALKALLGIYVTEHDWTQAIDVSRQLEVQAGEDCSREIAHYYCELADGALKAKDFPLAAHYLERAQNKNPKSVRVLVSQANLWALTGQMDKAKSAWQRVLTDFPQYSPLVLGRLADALRDEGDEAGALALLRETMDAVPKPDVILPVVERVAAWEGEDKAMALVEGLLQTHPTLLTFSMLTKLRRNLESTTDEARLLDDLLQRYAKKSARFQCTQCGFTGSGFTWHCLGCGGWDTIPALRSSKSAVKRTP